ncbi:unannotated protein [freshwater metagenome]|uniref:Unannotated protein n=1 Tax=freshwater metagenome TaxID=449393 RepID=A0A6J5ZW02_9ZZZZ|nr:hypothetical protein [Actinomycetota bacterium]
MSKPAPLEVTITHNLDDAGEVAQLFKRRLIALDWNRKGPNIASYTHRRARIDVKLFHEIRTHGAAVIAAYKGATDKPSDRLVGWVAPGSRWQRLNGLLCLPLTKARIVDSSSSFLGNLPPRQCTVQTCHRRSAGQLLRLVQGTALVRGVESLHHRDVEWLVMNFLFSQGLCATQWSGSRSFEDIDHAGYSPAGREVLAQTTVSKNLVGKKAQKLLLMKSARRDLLMFGPESARDQCPPAIRYWSIEEVFKALDRKLAGRWLIKRMLAETA